MNKINFIADDQLDRGAIELCSQFGVDFNALPDESTYLARINAGPFASKFEVRALVAEVLWFAVVGNALAEHKVKLTAIDYRVTPQYD